MPLSQLSQWIFWCDLCELGGVRHIAFGPRCLCSRSSRRIRRPRTYCNSAAFSFFNSAHVLSVD